jgi:hypothetical protein
MTISSTSRVAGPFTGTGAAAVLPFTFAAVDAASVRVVKADETALTAETDFTVTLNSDQSANPGGSVAVVAAAYTGGTSFYVTTETPMTQGRPFATQEGLNLKSVEAALDKLTIQQQEQAAKQTRALQLPIGEAPAVLPSAASRAGKVLGFGAGGAVLPVNPGGADNALRDDLATGNGSLTALEGGISLRDLDQALRLGTIHASLYSTLPTALAAWATNGGRLLMNRDWLDQLTADLFVNLSGDKVYFLDCDRQRTVRFTNSTHATFGIRLYASGPATLIVSPNLTVDGNFKTTMPFWVNFEALTNPAHGRNAQIGGTYKNARKPAPAGGISVVGLKIDGGFAHLRVHDFDISNVNRAAGSGDPGSQGSIGLGLSVWPKSVTIRDFRIDTVDCEDAAGSAGRFDMDGINLFNRALEFGVPNPEPDVIERFSIINAGGRAIKRFSPHGGGVTEKGTVIRNIHGTTSGSTDIDHQDGDGTIQDIVYRYSGNANAAPTTPFNFGTSHARAAGHEFKPAVAERITIHDSTGVAKFQICGTSYAAGGTPRRQFRFENITDHGTAQLWSRPSALGSYGEVTVHMEQIDVNLTSCLWQTDDTMANMRVFARSFTNRGATIPYARTLTSGAEMQFNWGYAHGENIRGVWRDTGVERQNGAYRCGFSGPGGGVESGPPPFGAWRRLSGRVDPGVVTIAAGAVFEGPGSGLLDAGLGVNNGGNYTWRIEFPERGGFAEGWTTCNNATLNIITGATGTSDPVTFLNTGAPGTSSTIEVYKNGVSGGLYVRNGLGGPIHIRIVLNPS